MTMGNPRADTGKIGPSGSLTANAVCALAMIIWAMGFPAADRLLVDFAPVTVSAFRMGFAAIFLLAVWIVVEGPRALSGTHWPKGLMIGGIGFGLGSSALLSAQAMTDATTVAVITSTLPVIGLALEAMLDGRRITSRLIFGVTLSLIGGIVAIAAGTHSLHLGLGAAFAFLSVLGFAWGSRATILSLPGLSPLGRTAVITTGAGLATTAFALLQIAAGQPLPDASAVTLTAVGLILFSAIASFALSQLLWIVSTEKLGIGIAAMHINAAPFYVMVLVYLLGGTWSWAQAGAALIVAIGVLIAQMPPRKPQLLAR